MKKCARRIDCNPHSCQEGRRIVRSGQRDGRRCNRGVRVVIGQGESGDRFAEPVHGAGRTLATLPWCHAVTYGAPQRSQRTRSRSIQGRNQELRRARRPASQARRSPSRRAGRRAVHRVACNCQAGENQERPQRFVEDPGWFGQSVNGERRTVATLSRTMHRRGRRECGVCRLQKPLSGSASSALSAVAVRDSGL